LAIRFGVSSTVKNRLPRYSNFWDGTAVYNPYSPTGSYDALAAYSIGSGGVSSVTFAGIPNTYTHLQIRGIARGSNSTPYDQLQIRFNGDSASNYSGHLMGFGDGYTNPPPSYNYANANACYNAGWVTGNTAPSGDFGAFVIDIVDYTNVNKFKTVKSLTGASDNSTGTYLAFSSSNWRNTSAINSINIFSSYGSTLLQFSQFALYGVKG
jgi:hypothetical protein